MTRKRRFEHLSTLSYFSFIIWKVKEVGRRRTQLLDDLRNRRRYWELKEKAEDRKR